MRTTFALLLVATVACAQVMPPSTTHISRSPRAKQVAKSAGQPMAKAVKAPVLKHPPAPVAPPPTNLTLTVTPAYPQLEIQGTTNMLDWTTIATMTNSTTNAVLILNNIQGVSFRAIRTKVQAARLDLTWVEPAATNVSGYRAILFDKNTNSVIATFDFPKTNRASILIPRPDRRVVMAIETLYPDWQMSAWCDPIAYIPTLPTQILTR